MKCELQPSLLPVQLLVRLPLHGLEQMQVQVLGAGAEAAAAVGDGAPCRAGADVGAGAGVDARSSGRPD